MLNNFEPVVLHHGPLHAAPDKLMNYASSESEGLALAVLGGFFTAGFLRSVVARVVFRTGFALTSPASVAAGAGTTTGAGAGSAGIGVVSGFGEPSAAGAASPPCRAARARALRRPPRRVLPLFFAAGAAPGTAGKGSSATVSLASTVVTGALGSTAATGGSVRTGSGLSDECRTGPRGDRLGTEDGLDSIMADLGTTSTGLISE